MDAWGKFDVSTTDFHRLEHHCADVAACFEAMLRDRVVRARLERASGGASLSPVIESRLTVIAFLHDFAKLNTGFQFKVPRSGASGGARRPRPAGHISEALWAFEQESVCDALGLRDRVDEWGEGFASLLLAALAHHGRPARRPSRTGSGPPELWARFNDYDPLVTARLFEECCRTWFPNAYAGNSPALPDAPAFAHLFAGLVALADQVGSDRESFPFEPDSDPDYIHRARDRARSAVRRKGFERVDRPSRAPPADFARLFGYPQPRPLQQAAADAPLERPLLILEAETGSGKTEAAILRFAALWRAGLVDGLYFALPTRAAARQIHARVDRALRSLFPDEPWAETVRAVPGYMMAGEAQGWPEEDFRVYWEDKPDEETRHARWAAEASRKFLSATAAVGTIDQALLAGLEVKWAHLRGAALARSLLVVDEAHASDPYMTELLRNLVQSHLAIGGHALLMSATLGATARTSIMDPGHRWEHLPTLELAGEAPYPSLTLTDADGNAETLSIGGTGQPRAVSMRLDPILTEPGSIAAKAIEAARDGAKILVIRNTVTSAQDVFTSILEQGGASLVLQSGTDAGPALHHSRFAAEDRTLLDECVENTLGKDRPPGGCVVIGTQTLEQSLDIDADLLISDLCPVDVLLQRIGRLHRHAETRRPRGFEAPSCLVLVPQGEAGGLDQGLTGGLLRYGLGTSRQGGGVYRNLLSSERTRRLVEQYPCWRIPGMNRLLVEQATHPEALSALAVELGGEWLDHEQTIVGAESAEALCARRHCLDRTAPFDDRLTFADLDEDVRTRLGEDGPRIVLKDPVQGPFGIPVRTFNLPRHLFGPGDGFPTREDIAGASAEITRGGLVLQVGAHRFGYDRQGMIQED